MHVLVGLEHNDPDVDPPLPIVARPDIIANVLGMRLIRRGQQRRLALLARRHFFLKQRVEVLYGERVEVQKHNAREVGLPPDVELGEEVAPARKGEHVAAVVRSAGGGGGAAAGGRSLGRVPGHELELTHNGALGAQDVALLLGDKGRDKDNDGVEGGAGDWVPQQTVDELLGREEVRVVDRVVARREVGGVGELARSVVVVCRVGGEGGEGQVGLAVLREVLLEGELDLVEGRGGAVGRGVILADGVCGGVGGGL